MAFLPKSREKMEDAESVSDLYELSGSEDGRLRNFWKNERPTSTENETSSENSYYPKSETETEISGTGSEQPEEIIHDQIQNLELSKIELKNENRKLEYKITLNYNHLKNYL